MSRCARILLSSALLLTALIPGRATAQFPCGNLTLYSTATFPNDPGFEGLYKYTLTGGWDTGQYDLTQIDLALGLEECPCRCVEDILQLPQLAGWSVGFVPEQEPADSCSMSFGGQYLCEADLAVPSEFSGPTVKYVPNVPEEEDCEPGAMSSGTWWFYSHLAPGSPTTHEDQAALLRGQLLCVGDVIGELPICQCQTAVESKTWGGVKSLYQ